MYRTDKIYKYGSHKNCLGLVQRGNIRVGTLHDFRDLEHKKGIADPFEGMKAVSHHVPSWTNDGSPSIHRDAADFFRAVDMSDAIGASITNVVFSREFDEPDCYLYCASWERSKEVMDSFEGADTCVEIFDTVGFFKELTRALGGITSLKHLRRRTIQYMPRDEIWNGKDWGFQPSTIKPEEFKPQKEVRVMLYPRDEVKIKPETFDHYPLTKFCRIVDVS